MNREPGSPVRPVIPYAALSLSANYTVIKPSCGPGEGGYSHLQWSLTGEAG